MTPTIWLNVAFTVPFLAAWILLPLWKVLTDHKWAHVSAHH